MSRKAVSPEQDELVEKAARSLLARAVNNRAVEIRLLTERLRHILEKYLLRDEPQPTAQAVSDFFARIHADELCLVLACEQGNETAWSYLINEYGATVRAAARSASSKGAEAEDLAQSIWAELYGLRENAEGKRAGKLGYYSGCGSLGGWLRAIVAQLAVDKHRRTSRFVQTEDDTEFDRLNDESAKLEGYAIGHTTDPENKLAAKRAGRDLQSALRQVINHLSAEDRLLIKLYYFDDLRLREAGSILGVHEATASRRLQRVQAEVREGVEKVLGSEHGWRPEEITRLFSDAEANVEFDLHSLFASNQTPSEGQKS
ncbi:MAG: sigma-70 family RNA polymerase sigma factor [Pyrinomonadaceae bacterium]|nr:sigma-70 family RNA polymerase sigma factor [Pyrinomonadaceae bacterium]